MPMGGVCDLGLFGWAGSLGGRYEQRRQEPAQVRGDTGRKGNEPRSLSEDR